jgi:hypothetical protein
LGNIESILQVLTQRMQSGKPVSAAKLADFEKASQLVMGEARLSLAAAGPSSPKPSPASSTAPAASAKPQPAGPAAVVQTPTIKGEKEARPYFVAPSFDVEEEHDWYVLCW